jgi:PTH2 family peptidyl-tRNA hydrolase
MSPGKLAAQVAHAAVSAVINENLKFYKIQSWKEEGQPKVVLAAINEDVLFQLQSKANEREVKNVLIRDAGRTELEPGTVTCLSIGPDEDSVINKLTGNLKLL